MKQGSICILAALTAAFISLASCITVLITTPEPKPYMTEVSCQGREAPKLPRMIWVKS